MKEYIDERKDKSTPLLPWLAKIIEADSTDESDLTEAAYGFLVDGEVRGGNNEARVYSSARVSLLHDVEGGLLYVYDYEADVDKWLEEWDASGEPEWRAYMGLDATPALPAPVDGQSVAVWVEPNYYQPDAAHHCGHYLQNDNDGEPQEFATAKDATAWVNETERTTYVCESGEATGPEYTVVDHPSPTPDPVKVAAYEAFVLDDKTLVKTHKEALGQSQALRKAIRSAGAAEKGPMARERMDMNNKLKILDAEMKRRGLTAEKAKKKKTAGHERGQER